MSEIYICKHGVEPPDMCEVPHCEPDITAFKVSLPGHPDMYFKSASAAECYRQASIKLDAFLNLSI